MACTGCIAVWQADHKVVANTGLAVTIYYDPLLLRAAGVANTAQSECHKFQRIAVLEGVRNGPTWTSVATFRCQEIIAPLKEPTANLPREPMARGIKYGSLPQPLPVAPPPVAKSDAAPSPEWSDARDVKFIDAIGPNWGITHRQVAKPLAAPSKAVSATAIKQSATGTQPFVKQVQSLKSPNLPVAILKGSLPG